jgi:hypothetical protein
MKTLITSHRQWLVLILLVPMLFVRIGYAQSYNQDAREAAEFIARSSVQTAYDNMRKNNISWPTIRDEKLPDMLDRVIQRLQTNNYSRRVLTDVYIPTFTQAFYDEVAKINRRYSYRCLTQDTLDIYVRVIVDACDQYLSIDVSVQVEDILQVDASMCTSA